MNKNFMLFIWFLKLGLFKSKDEYNLHDYIKSVFCPKYIPAEEFDEKEQLLRDTPGPAGIKYASYVGGRVNGIPGAAAAVFALIIPVAAAATAFFFAYDFLMGIQVANVLITEKIINGMHAATLGIIIAHLYKIMYFNNVDKKSLILILPSAAVFIVLTDITQISNAVLMPFYISAVVVLGILFAFIHLAAVKYREKHPKYVEPHSKKAIKLRDRQIRDEEESLRKYIDDDAIKLRRQQLREEEEKRKHKGEE